MVSELYVSGENNMNEEQKRREREMMKKSCRQMASDLGVFVCYTENGEVENEQ